MQKIKIPFLISTFVILFFALLTCLSENFFIKILVIPLTFISILINLVLAYIIYYLNKEVSVICSIVLFVFALWLFRAICINESELSSYESWQYYNHQTLIAPGFDLFFGKHIQEMKIFLLLLMLNFSAGFIASLLPWLKLLYYKTRRRYRIKRP